MDKKENKGLKPYESPSTKKTQVELEGNLCGSIDPTAQSPTGASTEAQKISKGFSGFFVSIRIFYENLSSS